MDKMTVEVMKAQFNLAMSQVDERLRLPIQRYVDALVKQYQDEAQISDLLAGKLAKLAAGIGKR